MTMVIDKGLGRNMFSDVIETASDYIDCVKFGFGTAPLYKTEIAIQDQSSQTTWNHGHARRDLA